MTQDKYSIDIECNQTISHQTSKRYYSLCYSISLIRLIIMNVNQIFDSNLDKQIDLTFLAIDLCIDLIVILDDID